MSTFHIIIISIVEGITEFLPISSTAHIDITRTLLGLPITEFIKSFEITIQLGAIFAVIVLYGKRVFGSVLYMRNILIAFIPTGIIGFILYKLIKSFLLGNVVLASTMLVIGGIIMVIFERNKKEDTSLQIESIKSLPIKKLLLLGTIQALAVVPGVSRSGAVIIGGRALGLNKILITEFSFILAVPTMLSAVAYDLLKSGSMFTQSEWSDMLLGFVVSFIVALVAIKWLLKYIKNHSFESFGWYRIFIGLVILVFFSSLV